MFTSKSRAPILECGGRLELTRASVVHVGYLVDGIMPTKLERNLRLLDLDLAERPFNPDLLSARASTLLGLGRCSEALVALHLCGLLVAGPAAAQTLASLKGHAYAREGMLEQALEEIRLGLEVCPTDLGLCFAEAELLAALGNLEECVERLRGRLALDEAYTPLVIADRTIGSFRARELLAEALLLLGDAAGAEVEARAAVAARPQVVNGWLTLGRSLLARGKAAELSEVVAHLRAKAESEVGAVVLEAAAVAEAGRLDEGLEKLDAALAGGPMGNGRRHVLMRAKMELLAECEARGPETLRLVEEVLRLAPLCPRARRIRRRMDTRSLGAILRAQGHPWARALPPMLGPYAAAF